MNILLVEDNEGDILVTQRAFRDKSSNLAIAHDGVEALAYLSKQGVFADAFNPDLILLDLNMPRMDGKIFLETVKQDDRFKHIPVVVLTSSNAPADIRECYQRYASCYILKPFDAPKYMETLKQVETFWTHLAQLPESAH